MCNGAHFSVQKRAIRLFRSHLKIKILAQDPPPKIGGTRTQDRVSTRPGCDGIFDRHTQVCRGLETKSQHRDLSTSGGLGQKTF